MSSFIIREATFSDINRITELRLMAQQHFEKSNPSIWRITKEGERLLKQKVENDLTDDNVQVARMPVPKFACEVAFAFGIAWSMCGDVRQDDESVFRSRDPTVHTRKREFRNKLARFGFTTFFIVNAILFLTMKLIF